MNELKIIENRVFKKILGSTHGTILEIMRGDIGALLMENKIMENRIIENKILSVKTFK